MNNKKKIIIIFLASILAVLATLIIFKTGTKKTVETTPVQEEIVEEEVVEVIEPKAEESEKEITEISTTEVEKKKTTKIKTIESNKNNKPVLQGTVDNKADTQDDGLININFSRTEDPSVIVITKEYNKPKPHKYIFK